MAGNTDEPDRWPAGTLRATAIWRAFEGVQALDGVTLELARHEVVGLIGPNGAGKSTLVNIITGFDVPDKGMIFLGDDDVTGWSPHRLGRYGLARTFQAAHSFQGLSVRENIEVSALGSGAAPVAATSRADRLLEMFDLTDSEALPAGVLSHGHERKLGVARALATDPRYVLMDEPAAGLNEAEVIEFGSVIRDVRDEHGVGVLLIDHNIGLILDVCERIEVLDQGRTIAAGPPEDIRGNDAVATAYLGTIGVEGRDG